MLKNFYVDRFFECAYPKRGKPLIWLNTLKSMLDSHLAEITLLQSIIRAAQTNNTQHIPTQTHFSNIPFQEKRYLE